MKIARFSLIITVFKSEANIPPLLEALSKFATENADLFELECVFVVDGSPDKSYFVLLNSLPIYSVFSSQLIQLSRNFGAPFALRCGFEHATGNYFSNIAADMQEPLEAVKRGFEALHEQPYDIGFFQRTGREDPFLTNIVSNVYWTLYRAFIEPDVPKGGVDFFVINRRVRDQLLQLPEKNIFMVGLLFWMGFRRIFIPYHRGKRQIGRSSWSLKKRLNYFMDSLFLFSDLPLKFLLGIGSIGLIISLAMIVMILINKYLGNLPLPGYSATMTTILFFGGINSLGLGLVGEYLWRTFENTKQRPLNIVMDKTAFHGKDCT